jgi:hypothetical protein
MRADAHLYTPFRANLSMHVLASGLRTKAKAIESENKFIVEYDSIKSGYNDLKGYNDQKGKPTRCKKWWFLYMKTH